MKSITKLVAALATLPVALLTGRAQPVPSSASAKDSFSNLARQFADPPVAYSTAPLWVWNGVVTEALIDQQLEAFRKENIAQVFIHPRPGLITEYLSDEWFRLCRYALEKGKSLGMNVWLYDENSFPSGFAGGHVQANLPESYRKGSALGIRRGAQIVPDSLNTYLVLLKKETGGFVPVETLPAAHHNDYYAFEILHEPLSGWYGGFSYVDLLMPGVTETFIAETMNGYERALGDEFGQRVPGIFTDEPNIAPRAQEKNVIRWTPTLLSDFKQQWGYDLASHLPSLFEDVGDFRKVRYHYYRLLLERFIERWSKPWYTYTESKHLAWTGHYWEHGWPDPHHGGDNMAMYAWHQIPGIDMLFNTPERPGQFGNVRAVKELSSVANQLGKQRALSETYGAAGWDLSFEDMKRLGDWQYALGVNFTSQHLSYMTLKGRRKGDFPQSFLTHAPYWEDYGVLAQYYHRLSWALSRGEQRNRTLILEPTTTAWMHYRPAAENEKLAGVEQAFRELVDTLEQYQLEYDLGSENIIKDHGKIDGDQFIVGERAYRVVILPPYFESIDQATFRLLRQYTEAGGRVLSMAVPTYLNGQQTDSVRRLAADHPDNWRKINAVTDSAALPWLQNRHFRVEPEGIPEKVYHQRRSFKDGQLIFWTNFDAQETARVTFSQTGRAVSRLDPLSGTIEPYPCTLDQDRVRVSFDLPAAGSLLLFVHDEPVHDAPPSVEAAYWTKVATRPSAVSANGPNVLALDYLDLKVEKSTLESLYFTAAADSAYRLNGLTPYGRLGYNPWVAAVQYRTNVLDRQEQLDSTAGFAASYHFRVQEGYTPKAIRAIVEWPQLYRVTLNGQAISPLPDEPWLDHAFGAFDITDAVRPGRNTLTLSATPMDIHAEIEAVFLTGDFGVEAADEGFVVTPPAKLTIGPWDEQKMPFYFRSVSYTQELQASAGYSYKVQLNDWNGTVARVKINDKLVGIIGWPPYSLEVSQWLTEGRNDVTVEVVGSLSNLFGPHHNDPPPGIVTPWSWYYTPETQPAGQDYHFHAYGLLSDFDILRAKALQPQER